MSRQKEQTLEVYFERMWRFCSCVFVKEVAHGQSFHFEMSNLNEVAPKNILRMSVTVEISHFDTSTLNDVASRNISRILVTRDTTHLETSLLKDFAP